MRPSIHAMRAGGKPLLVGRVIVHHTHSEHAGMMLWSLAIAYHAILSFRSTELRASFTLHSLVLVPTDRPHVNPIHVAPFQSITIVVPRPRPFLWSTTATLEGNRVRLNIAHWDQETEMICGGGITYFTSSIISITLAEEMLTRTTIPASSSSRSPMTRS